MIAVDANILIYAHRRDSEWHPRAAAKLRELSEGMGAWALLWPCVHEFLAIVTHPRIYAPPSTLNQAISQATAWMDSPSVTLLAESADHWAALRGVLETSRVVGPRVHDARIAALCMTHGVRELWTADRDFSAFPGVTVRNPLIEPARRK
ncbi:MAG: PIN domain-containing protein [Alphaproteobacteria bacterium]|nr:PIN domain-containing protein [Alphaproteobacteria bacterium]